MPDRKLDEQASNDLKLMRRVAQGDSSAVSELYDRFGSLVYRMSAQAMPTRADAEDAVQEIFFRLNKTADRYDPERAALVTWVMLISRRHLVDKLRRRPKTGDPRDAEYPAGLNQERQKELMRRIETLPELQRIVVQRAYLGGQTLRQIAEELNAPLATIKSALSRALSRLRSQAEVDTERGGEADHSVPVSVEGIHASLIKELQKHPERMRSMDPRKFEELVAELLQDRGCDVQLTPPGADGGRDVLAEYRTPVASLLLIAQCKRWAFHRPVGIEVVERFLWTIRDHDRASLGIIAATTTFTGPARLRETEYKWQLKLQDYEQLREWLAQYGRWDSTPLSELWTPKGRGPSPNL